MKYSLFIIGLLALLCGCDMFTARDPQEPESARSNFATAATPEDLLQNLKNAISDKVPENYISCFVDSSFSNKKFVFEPSAGSANKYPYLAQWSLLAEKQYFNNLKSAVAKDASITLVLSNENKIQYGDSLLYTADYSLSIPVTDTKIPRLAEGSLRFSVCRDNRTLWVISRWRDIKKGNSVSWSELKGILY